MYLILGIYRNSFLSINSVRGLFKQVALNGIMSTGMTVLFIAGWYDLSVGSVMSFTGIVVILLQPYGIFVSVTAGIVSGLLIGLLNGLLVLKGNINTFIATMGSMVIFKGLGLGLTDSKPVKGTIAAFEKLGQGVFLGIDNQVWIMAIFFVLVWYLLKYTQFGRNSYAIGGNFTSATMAGINVKRYAISYFVLSALSATVAGILLASQANGASALYGTGIEIWIMVAVIIGGTSLAGGKGGVIGSLYGTLLLGLVERSMIMFNVDSNYQSLFRALVIIAVVVTDAIISNKERMEEKSYDLK
jgi:ribose transport system permease protein